MATWAALYPQLLAGTAVGRTSDNTGQNEDYYRLETAPSGDEVLFHFRNKIVSQYNSDAADQLATDWTTY